MATDLEAFVAGLEQEILSRFPWVETYTHSAGRVSAGRVAIDIRRARQERWGVRFVIDDEVVKMGSAVASEDYNSLVVQKIFRPVIFRFEPIPLPLSDPNCIDQMMSHIIKFLG